MGGARRACFKNIPRQARIVLVFLASFLHRIQDFYERVGCPTLALDAANTGGPATFVYLGHGGRIAEYLVQVADWAQVRVARIAAPHTGGVGHHGLKLLAD